MDPLSAQEIDPSLVTMDALRSDTPQPVLPSPPLRDEARDARAEDDEEEEERSDEKVTPRRGRAPALATPVPRMTASTGTLPAGSPAAQPAVAPPPMKRSTTAPPTTPLQSMPKSLSQLFDGQNSGSTPSSLRSSGTAPLEVSPRVAVLGTTGSPRASSSAMGVSMNQLLLSPDGGSREGMDLRSHTSFASWLRDPSGELRDPFLVFARPIVFHIISYLSDSDLYTLSICSKRLLQYSLADAVVWERRQQRQFPFNVSALWRNLIAKRYPAMRMAEALLSWPEKNAVIRKYIGDTVDKNEKWSTEVYDAFVAAGVVGSTTRDRAVFYLYNVIRKPQLRLPKIVDKFFENAELVREAIGLFDLTKCTLFEALHLIFGHALSLPGEAQKIDRVMTEFGTALHRAKQASGSADKDTNTAESYFVLAFAVVMLNSDLHNPSVKNRMSLQQFRCNIEGTITLTAEEAHALYMQVLRVEMIERSCFVPRLTKRVWLVRSMGPIGYIKKKRANVTLCAGELVVDGGLRFTLKSCLVARNIGSNNLATARGAQHKQQEMSLLHVMRVGPEDDPETLLRERFSGRDLIITCDDVEDLKELQRAMASHMLPNLQRLLNSTLRHLAREAKLGNQ